MLNIPRAGYPHRKISRRDFLHIGGIGAASTLLANALPFNKRTVTASEVVNKELNVKSPHELRFITKDGQDPNISLIVIDLQGGASWFDMFDWKPNSPFKIFNPKDTTCPEITITEPLAPLAKHLHKLVVFRNLFSENSFHDSASSLLYTGKSDQESSSFGANAKYLSSLVEFSKYLNNSESKNIGYLVVHSSGQRHEIVEYEKGKFKEQLRSAWREPFPGTHFNHAETIYAPYNTAKGDFGIELGNNEKEYLTSEFEEGINFTESTNQKAKIALIKSRLQFLEKMDGFGHSLAGPTIERWKNFQAKVNNVLEGDVNEAFDLSQEPEEVRLKYGDSQLGKQLLLARRLVQRGVRTVAAQHGDFDHHELIEKNLNIYLPEFAIALSALLDDIEKLGLKTVVAVVTEFGRTPRINRDQGRDHWNQALGAIFAGYGIEGGKLIGKTNTGGYPCPDGEKIPVQWMGDTLLDKMQIARFELRNGLPTNARFPYIKF